jgi:ribosome-binding protein aMBF1 (putative translation factor)
MSKKTVSTKELKKRLMKSAAFKREYEVLEPEFALAQVLVAARAKAGLTQVQVAEKMGTDQAVVARLEGGKKPSLSTLERYAEAVGRSLRIQLV